MHAPAHPDERFAARVLVREATEDDAGACGRIFYDAFESIAVRHHFPIEPTSREFTRFKVAEMLSSDGFTGLIAERDGQVRGSAFIDQRGVVGGIGPVTVDPETQDEGIGRALMEAALDRERHRGAVGIRLVQTAYHYRSFALYARLGFVVREPLTVLQGAPPTVTVPGREVRPATDADLTECADVCRRVHGHSRAQELREAIAAGTARLVEHAGRVSGYATGFGYGWHAVADANDDLIALLGSAEAYMGLGILVPSRNVAILRWGLDHGMRIVQQSTLMTIGLYNEPVGAYLASILF
jgi:GNAT superfamily N-acetyltransferase